MIGDKHLTGRIRRQDALAVESEMGKPSASQTVAPSLHLSLWGPIFSQLRCSVCGCSIASVHQLSAYSGLFCSSVILACIWLSL